MRNNKKRVILAVIAAVAAAVGAAAIFLKRRRNKIFFMALALAAVIFCGSMGAGMTAYANEPTTPPGTEQPPGAEQPQTPTTEQTDTEPYYTNEGESESEIIYVETEVTEVITGEAITVDMGDFLLPGHQPNLLTPPGNMTLVDDIQGRPAEDLQFITVATRNGFIFYIIVDRAGEVNNVHFLNQVSELDLLQIFAELEDENAVSLVPLPPSVIQPGEGEPKDVNGVPQNGEAQSTSQGNNMGLLLMVIAIAAVGGGAYYYFKIRPKQQSGGVKKPVKVEEFDFDPDEDDLFSDNAEYSGGMGEYDGAGMNGYYNGEDSADFDDMDGDIFNDHDHSDNHSGAHHDYTNGDYDDTDDLPDFRLPDETAEPEQDGEDFPFESADLGEETPESEGR